MFYEEIKTTEEKFLETNEISKLDIQLMYLKSV